MAAVIVGGLEVEVSGDVYWTTLENLVAEANSQKLKPVGRGEGRVEQLGTPGRALQVALLEPVNDWQSFGETDWLPWMRLTRNGMTHRAPAKRLNVTDNSNDDVAAPTSVAALDDYLDL